jgi:hypothetical protein
LGIRKPILEHLISTIEPQQKDYQADSSEPIGQLGAKLQAVLRQGRVLDRAIDRIAFSSDASFYKLVPRAVVQPATLNEIRDLFSLVPNEPNSARFPCARNESLGTIDYRRASR